MIREVKKLNKSKKFDLLEALSQVLANRIMKMSDLVEKVLVRIEKPSPPIDEKLDAVGVEYTLSRDGFRPVKTGNKKPGNTVSSGSNNINEAYLSLGSNTGNRKLNLKKAIKLLGDNPEINIDAVSSIYETEPMYIKDQENFYNLVIRVSISSLGPFELLGFIKAIEYKLGRKKGGTRYGPRPIDIDILYFGDEIIESEILEVPHPGIGERKFVLLPLSEIAPDIMIEGSDINKYIKKANLPEKVELVSSLDIP